MYSTDIRVATTASPSFQNQVNVGGFGWTGSDQAHFNQLLQYVEECQDIKEYIEEKVVFVETAVDGMKEIQSAIQYVNWKANDVAEDARQISTTMIRITTIHKEIENMSNALVPVYEDFLVKYADFLKKYEEIMNKFP